MSKNYDYDDKDDIQSKYGGKILTDHKFNIKEPWSLVSDIKDIDTYAKDIEYIKDNHNFYKEILADCYKIVIDYIRRNNRILVGGMAIDHALKLKGSFLYDTDKIDYDFITPEFHKDAYNIGQELSKKYDNISVIGARHVSTMRVRYNFMVVADVTYVPQNIYDKIPTIEYEGVRNIHPHVQMIDQHRAMHFALENPPLETIISSRYEKDFKRYAMLYKYYPIEINKSLSINLKSYVIPYDYINGNCLGGYAAAIYWFKKANISSNMNLVFEEDKIKILMPEDGTILIFTDDIEMHKEIKANKKYYNRLLDKIPRRVQIKDDIPYEFYDNYGEIIVAENYYNFHILGLAGTMLWLLTQGTFYKNEWCLYMYAQLSIIFIKEGITKYLPSFEFFGKKNISDANILQFERQLIKLGYMDADLTSTPKNFYPKKNQNIPEQLYNFDPLKSKFYNLDGLECSSFN
jgi:hypothetical protein